MFAKIKSALLTGTSAALIMSVFAGCSLLNPSAISPSPSEIPSSAGESSSPSPSPATTLTKNDIQKALDSQGEKVIDVTWAPDDSMVVFIQEDDEAGSVYVWKTNTADAQLVSSAEGTTDGFLWSPDSKHFLINVGHMGPGTITSTLVDAESLSVLSDDIATVSVSPPVWSPDSRFIALSADDLSTNDIKILVYAVASGTSVSVLSSNNKYGPYVVESWINDTLTYTEITASGERAQSSLLFGE
ncbi:MAG: hypothetical protein VB064_01990 [Oscillospiraceae bacterium]|nr:hypothetical protein [Oscillospiraceae bacterium]